jgi:peptidoglycan/LPS O-acetylase OafA/YrhL
VLFPDRVPNIVGPVMPPGTPLSEQHAANATEASDPYFGLLMFGGMLVALLWVMARPPIRAAMTVGLLCLLAVPPLVLAGTAQDFPGSRAITTATLALVIGAIFTARPAPAATSSQRDERALT